MMPPDDPDYSQFIRPGGVPFGWTPPPGPTPGQVYAAYGDTGAATGETEGLSPAMRQMIRRNLGRLADQSMAERQRTAEQAMRGASLVGGFVNPVLGAATAGLTSRFMGDTAGETAGRVASALLPAAGARAFVAAPGLTAGAFGAGAAMQPSLKSDVEAKGPASNKTAQQEKTIGDAVSAPFDEEERKARADFQQEYERAMREKQIPGEKRKSVIAQESLDAKLKDIGERRRAAREGAIYRAGIQNDTDLQFLPPRYMDRVANAFNSGGIDAANKERNAVREETMPLAQRHPDWVQAGELGGMGLGFLLPMGLGWRSGGYPGRMADRAESAMGRADRAIEKTGNPSLNAENRLTASRGALEHALEGQGGWRGVGNELGHLAVHAGLGTALPWAGGTIIPNGFDSFLLPEDVKARDINGKPLDISAREVAAERVTPSLKPAFTDPLTRSLTNSAAVATAGHLVGRGGSAILRPLEDQISRGTGLVKAIDRRAAGYPAPGGMQAPGAGMPMPAPSPAPPAGPQWRPSAEAFEPGPAPMTQTPPPAPAPSPSRFPPPMWQHPETPPPTPSPPPLTSLPPMERPPGYIPNLNGAALRSHLMRLERENPASFVYPPQRNR